MPPFSSPFHEGERRLQERLGLAERMALVASKGIRPFMPDQHRGFFPLLPLIMIGHADQRGRPWASILTGPKGFVQSPDPTHLAISAKPIPGDPLEDSLKTGLPVGLLGLEFHTRRRNRANGVICRTDDQGVTVSIEQSFGNCPKYIQTRSFTEETGSQASQRHEPLPMLDGEAASLIKKSDCFFIASEGPGIAGGAARSVDVSHRGGLPGFVRLEEGSLLVPDYSGNRFFNTLGNILLSPKAGLLFPDFRTGDLLQMTGRVDLILEGPEIARLPGAERAWRFTPDQIHWLRSALPFREIP